MKYSDRKISMYPSLKGAFTYYIITGGQGVGGSQKILMHGYGGWGGGWPCDDRH